MKATQRLQPDWTTNGDVRIFNSTLLFSGEYVKSDTHKPTCSFFFFFFFLISVGGGLYGSAQDHNIIGSLFTLGESSFPSSLPDLPSRSWISHGENSKRQPSCFENPLLMSLWGTDGMGYRVKERPLQFIWAFIFSSATPGSQRTPFPFSIYYSYT